MKDIKKPDEKSKNKEKHLLSPMKTLFRLTVNIKKSKNNSLEKRKKQPSTSFLHHNNNHQLNKVNSVGNITENSYKSTIFSKKKQKQKHSSVELKENKINNCYNNNSNLANTYYSTYVINDTNNNYNNGNAYTTSNSNEIFYKNINENNDLNNRKAINTYHNINYNKKKLDNLPNNNISLTNNNDINNNKIKKFKKSKLMKSISSQNKINISKSLNNFDSSFDGTQNIKTASTIFNNHKLNKKLRNSTNLINNKINLANKFYKNENNINIFKNKERLSQNNYIKDTIEEIEMPLTNRNSSYINFYNNILKNNNMINKNKYSNLYKEMSNNINTRILNETLQPRTTINNEHINLNDYNLRNTTGGINQNQNIIFNIKKKYIKNENSISTNNSKSIPLSSIYSPKKVLYKVHSQETVINNDIEPINSNTENRIIYKNKSIKENNGPLPYNKKVNIYKSKNNNDVGKSSFIENIKKGNDDDNNNITNNTITNKNSSNIFYKKNNIEDKTFQNNNDFNLIINKEENYLIDEKKYEIEPDIYPEIKINLRKEKNKKIRKNNSVIEDITKYNISNYNYKNDNQNSSIINEEKNKNKKVYNLDIYSKINNKNKPNDDMGIITTINNKNISTSFLSNANKSIIFTNTNLSITNNTLSDFNNVDFISSKTLKFKEKHLSVKDLYYILIMEEKIKDIADALSLDNIEIICNYCFELINYAFNFSMNIYIQNALINVMEIKNIISCNNYSIFSIIILYDLSFDEKTFLNVKILIKELLKLIYSNIILIINHSKNIVNKSEENASILFHIINNIQNKYIHNKELYIDDSEYLLIDQTSPLSCEEKINYNLNFIIRNIHTIINNMKNTKNFIHFLNFFKKINNISFEDINQFFRNKILKINIINSSLLSSTILKKNNLQNNTTKIKTPYVKNKNTKKYTLVISLDETLIHFKKGSIKNNKGVIQLRPGLTEFFEDIKPYYEIVIFSNGSKKYSDIMINSIEGKEKNIDYRLYRDHCIIYNNDFVKDITKIGRPINKLLIVDNLPQNFRLNKENGIYIKSFYGDNANDKILFNLSKLLVKIGKKGGDIREEIKKNWDEIINKINSNIYNNYYYK